MRGYAIAIFLCILFSLIFGTGMAFATRFDEAIAAGFGKRLTPKYAYISGVNMGGLDRQALVDELSGLIDTISNEEFIIWLDEDEYYAYPLKKLGFDPDPSELAGEIFADKYPPGFGLRQLAKRHEAIRKGLRAAIPLGLDEDALREFLTVIKGNIDREPRDAYMDFENQCLSEAQEGRRLDIDATIDAVPDSLDNLGPVTMRPVIDITEVKIKSSDLTDIDPTEPLSSYTTEFNKWKRGRSKNIGMLADIFRGVTLKPGEQFSFNAISGPRNRQTGFHPAPEFKEHRIIDGYGGGSCQVSTTLYNAALLAGMQIDERQPHGRVVFYVPRGMDATVNYDSRVDLKFTNVLDRPVVIWSRCEPGEGWITFEIYGYPDDRQEIEITNSYSTIWRSPEMDQYIIDESLAAGEEVIEDKGTNGVRARTWRHFIQPDGTRITEELFYDVIPAMGRIVRHNPIGGKRPASVASHAPEPQASTDDDAPPGVYF